MHNYELFNRKDNEIIVEVFTRCIGVVNDLQALGKIYTK